MSFLLNDKPLEIVSTENKIIKLKIPEMEQLSKNFVLKISVNEDVYSPRIHQIRLTIKL